MGRAGGSRIAGIIGCRGSKAPAREEERWTEGGELRTDKDRVLPMAVEFNHSDFWGAVAQRDADWERVKPLVEAAACLAADIRRFVSFFAIRESYDKVIMALATLGVEEKKP